MEGFLSVVLFLAMVAIVCWSVICRYALKIPFLQSEELARYLMIYIVYIGTPNKALLAKRILLCSLFAGKETG